jgi:hypothetical protein
MTTIRTTLLAASMALLVTPVLLAHEVTHKGTVVSADKTTVTVSVINEKTKKPAAMKFDVDKDTKILRGDTLVTMADARIEKNEKIAVTIDHDADETLAIVIRLDARK